MSEAHTLVLNGDSLRAGVDGWQLGATHAELDSSLQGSSVWQAPVCDTGKTALQGTGRLFQTEHCSVEAAGEVLLQDRQVRRLDFFLLDQQLVRLDVALAERTSTDNPSNLPDLLATTYASAGEERSGDASAEQPAHALWRHLGDQIRLYPKHSLQFIDGRLESSLPSLYDLALPVDPD